jgi:hypothetical protein
MHSRFAVHKPIDDILVASVAHPDHNVVHGVREFLVSDKRQQERMGLLVAVSIVERDYKVRSKSVEDCRDRLNGDSRLWCTLLRVHRSNRDSQERWDKVSGDWPGRMLHDSLPNGTRLLREYSERKH